ncbi:MAG: hydantoinase/oxoprolinase family protein [Rhodobiaceae bacterium]|nr:hydantoinase/oxoprolinase family protein [Rhodobiaceae bacterium]
MGWRIGVDSGGTFTDVCMFDEETGRIEVWKTSSTPDDPSRGIADVVSEGLGNVGGDFADIKFFGHGTTVATNALIELRGADTVMLTTQGFRDLLEIGRQKRPSLYDMMAEKPPVIVPRDRRLEVDERVKFDGTIDTPLTDDKIDAAIASIRELPHDAIAICFLYGYLNSHHESKIAAKIRDAFPEAFVSVSHEVAPEFREFERMTTSVVNAFLGPIMKRYINRLSGRLTDAGLKIAPNLTQSNGGVIGFDAAQNFPVKTLLSGPSTGVIAAQAIAEAAGFNDIITFDVGGTSSDVALMQNRICKRTGEADVHGYPIKAPMLDIHTVGAGGGSVAYVDSGGLLKVGPESAGANPGPVCYGIGGKKPTVTDANIILQTLNPVEILGGRMKVRKDLAEEAIGALAKQLGLGLEQTAQGIISLATANMAKAIRLISVQRGYDPRDYALMAFGGGGPLHAARLAQELDMSQIIIPTTPGTLCALGLLMTDLAADFAKTLNKPLGEEAIGALEEGFAALEEQGGEWFASEHVKPEARRLMRVVDLRYAGQNYELQIDLPSTTKTENIVGVLRERFDAAHRQRFGFAVDGEVIEIVTLRVQAIGVVQKAELAREDQKATTPPQPTGHRPVWIAEENAFVECLLFNRADLHYGHVIEGPAIIEQMDTTTFVLPGMTAKVDAVRNLILEFQK